MKKEPKSTNTATTSDAEEPTITNATAAAAAEAEAVHVAAVAAFEAKRKEHRSNVDELARAHTRASSIDGPDFMTVRYPLEAQRFLLQKEIFETEHAVRLADHHWGRALDVHEAKEGDPDAQCVIGIVDRLRALATQTQTAGDPSGVIAAAGQAIAEHEHAFTRLADKRRKAGKPLPQKVDGPRAWRVLQEGARAEKHSLTLTPSGLAMIATGYTYPLPPGTTVAQVVDLFTTPQPPVFSVGKIDHIDRELATLHTRAFDLQQKRDDEAAERARLTKEAETTRRLARERDERAAAERRAEQEKASAAARARNVKLEAFVRSTATTRRVL